ncbi:MAG: trehalose-phosphatase [Terriglobia bacterium]|jgi:trehalose 6-phosphate phosphatase
MKAHRGNVATGLFDSWPQVVRRLRATNRWLLLLDFDGTLVPVNDNPSAVSLDPLARQVLRRLARHRGSRVYIMSGRRLADLRRRVKIPGVHLLGLHGWERRGATLPPAQKHLLHQAKLWLAERLPALPGIAVEDKGYALAVHYRGATLPAVRVAGQALFAARDHFRPGLRLLKGRKIWELLPRAIVGKGRATQGLLKGLPADTLPIFIGDDTSDESAFAVLRHGLAVHVGAHTKTKAAFCLRDPGEVREFLERLEAVISCKESSPHSNS